MLPSFINLVLFLSRATSLKRWESMGILARELASYKYNMKWLNGLSIVTSGGRDELAYQKYIPEARILYNLWNLSPNLYSLLAPLLHAKTLEQANIFKSNQLDGAWTAILAGKLHRKPVIVRAGYLWAETFRLTDGSRLKAKFIDRMQRFSISRADALIVTTEAIKKNILENYLPTPKPIYIVPNAVDIELFRPLHNVDTEPLRICFVGRLSGIKNIDILIKASTSIPRTRLVIIGEGDEKQKLEDFVRSKEVDIQFLGKLPQSQIPTEINRSQLFVLPSSSEGHPKALIEAMACGVAVIGTDVPGIRELIEHGKTGWLCPPTVDGLRNAIQFLFSNPDLRSELGKNARQFIIQNFSLEETSKLEKVAIEETVRKFFFRKI